MDKLL
jgi:DNA replication licensing factor MCM6